MSMDVSSVLNSIKTAADALEEKPRLESRISELSREVDALAAHNAGLESNIINYKSTIDSLNEKVRSLEVERDQAQFRVETMEKHYHNLAAAIQFAADELALSNRSLYPPAPEPTPKPVAVADAPVTEGQPASPPFAPTPETPTMKYTGLTWSQAREKYGNGVDGVTYRQDVWLDNGGTEENWHL